MNDIRYGEVYDGEDGYEYRNVTLPNSIAQMVPRGRLLSELEWRSVGIQMSPGWEHYALYDPEPNVLLFRRPTTKKRSRSPSPKRTSKRGRKSPMKIPSPKGSTVKSREVNMVPLLKGDLASPKYKGIEEEDKLMNYYKNGVHFTSKDFKRALSLYRKRETERIPTDYFNTIQSEMSSNLRITNKMRITLFDWMSNQVTMKFTLLPNTLFLSYKLVDLFLSERKISKNKLQLVGVGSMVIAGKYEEKFAPLLEDYEWISAKNTLRGDIRRIESIMLNSLEWRVNPVTEYDFLHTYREIFKPSDDAWKECINLLHLVVFNEKYLTLLPSLKAALTMYIHVKKNGGQWSEKMKNWTQYSEGELHPYVESFNDVFSQAKSKIFDKYEISPLDMSDFVMSKSASPKSPSKKSLSPKSPSKKSPSKSPKKSPSKSPKKSPSKSPKKSPSKSPKKSPSKSPKKSPSKKSLSPMSLKYYLP